MSGKHAEIDFNSMNWRSPPNGWPVNIAKVPFILSAGPSGDSPASWLEGSNCQRFAYGVLSLFDLNCPPLRSSNLWKENDVTSFVSEPEPLDIVFFNGSDESYGAHIGIHMAPGEVLHLSKEIGIPTVWTYEEFAIRPRYSTIIGLKRVLRN